MSLDNENISKNGWSEYGRLVLKELERLNESQIETNKSIQNLTTKLTLVEQEIDAHRNVDEKVFAELAKDISKINGRLDDYVEKVNEVWSPKQMQQVKNEVYKQKNQYQKLIGVFIAIQIVLSLLIAFKDELF